VLERAWGFESLRPHRMSGSAEGTYAVVKRWRPHWPDFVTRVRLIDRDSGATIDLTSAALAELFLSGVRSEEAAPAVEPKLQH
jgi:hypothetical protein